MLRARPTLKALLLSGIVLAASSVWGALTPISEKDRCKVLGDNPNDGPRAMQMLIGWVAEHLYAADSTGGDWLERDVNEWNIPTCVLDDGRHRLIALLPGYSKLFEEEADWSNSLYKVRKLREKFPQSAFSALAEANYWRDYAWVARGRGYASSVSPDAWKLFRERLEKSEKILIETKPYSAELPPWYSLMINVQSALGRPEDERNKTFLEGAEKFKNFTDTYITMMSYLTPQWGGNWEAVDSLVSWAVENTKGTEGTLMYARLYSNLPLPSGVKLFGDTRAEWPKMKKGYEDLMKRYPASKWNLNNFARYACLANDKSTYASVRKRIGKDVMAEAFETIGTIDLCDRRMGYTK